MTDDQKGQQDRSRLIDHFKRVYTIVAGLAITEAVKRQLPLSSSEFPTPSFWMFCTFLVTLVPIFHGGDRSLDVKYLGAQPVTAQGRFWYLWDVYILLITAMLFVCIAEAIPATGLPASKQTLMAETTQFYNLMALTLAFDAVALTIDAIKSDRQLLPRLSSYVVWIPANLALAGICIYTASLAASASDATAILIQTKIYDLDLLAVTLGVALLALLRTVLDYWAGRDFLFP